MHPPLPPSPCLRPALFLYAPFAASASAALFRTPMQHTPSLYAAHESLQCFLPLAFRAIAATRALCKTTMRALSIPAAALRSHLFWHCASPRSCTCARPLPSPPRARHAPPIIPRCYPLITTRMPSRHPPRDHPAYYPGAYPSETNPATSLPCFHTALNRCAGCDGVTQARSCPSEPYPTDPRRAARTCALNSCNV